MSYYSRPLRYLSPQPLGEQLLRDVTSLLIMGHLISRSLHAVRPECAFSRELTQGLDLVIGVSDAGEAHLYQPLLDAGAVIPATTNASAIAMVTGFFTRLPAGVPPAALATEIAVNLRLLAQHVELKASRAAGTAQLEGEERLSQALCEWAAEWRACGRKLQLVASHPRADADTAEFPGLAVPLSA